MRSLLADLYVRVRLYQSHLIHAVEDQVAYCVDAVSAVLFDSAGVDVCEVCVCTALFESYSYLYRSRLVIELDPQALKKLKRFLIIEYAVFNILFIIRDEVLVESSRAERVPWVQLCGDSKVCEPVELYRLPECLRLVSRNDVEVLYHLLKLCPAHLIFALFSFFLQQLLISLSENHHCIAVDQHGLELVFLLKSFRIVHEIQRINSCLDLFFIVSVSLCEYVLAPACMSRASLLHELSKHAGSVAFLPLMRHAREQLVSHGFSFPERNDDLFLILEVLISDSIVDDLSVVHDIHVFKSVACEFRECRRRLRILALLTDDKLSLAEVKSLFAEVLLEHHGSEYRKGYLALIFFVDFRLDLRSFEVDVRLCLHAHLSESLYPCIHSAFFHFMPPL